MVEEKRDYEEPEIPPGEFEDPYAKTESGEERNEQEPSDKTVKSDVLEPDKSLEEEDESFDREEDEGEEEPYNGLDDFIDRLKDYVLQAPFEDSEIIGALEIIKYEILKGESGDWQEDIPGGEEEEQE